MENKIVFTERDRWCLRKVRAQDLDPRRRLLGRGGHPVQQVEALDGRLGEGRLPGLECAQDVGWDKSWRTL